MKGPVESLDPMLVQRLLTLEKLCGFELWIDSGARSLDQNAAAGGVSDSAHLISPKTGVAYAVDLACLTSWERMKLVKNALSIGITRMGIGRTFVHLDTSPFLPQDVLWHYYPEPPAPPAPPS